MLKKLEKIDGKTELILERESLKQTQIQFYKAVTEIYSFRGSELRTVIKITISTETADMRLLRSKQE
jgi:hypothetical protein